MTREELTAIYNDANGLDPKRHNPITTERIFAAMRAVADKEREACAKRLNDRAAELRAKAFPHMHEEKAQTLDYAADLVRSNAEVSGAGTASAGLPGYTAGTTERE